MLQQDINSSPEDLEDKDQLDLQNDKQQWPFLLWFYLKSLGLYHSGMYFIIW